MIFRAVKASEGLLFLAFVIRIRERIRDSSYASVSPCSQAIPPELMAKIRDINYLDVRQGGAG
jgi:hypothetical protein